MADLDKLRDEHTVILRIVERLRYLISQPSLPPQLHLFALRHELTTVLVAHLKTEDWVLYPLLLASSDPDIASIAHAFTEEMGGLAVAYIEHCEQWDADAIASDWAGYRLAGGALLDALTNRIKRENRELYPMLKERQCKARERAAA